MCRRLRDAGSSFEGGEKVVVVIVNDVGCADGGCADVVSGDVAGLVGSLGGEGVRGTG
jgi:hypothetical protein